MTNKKHLNLWQLINMSVGFFGIQFGWGLQMANMSAIFEHLGANAHQIPILWLAAPLTGLFVQPIIGYLSDQTWTRLGRRRPYFLIGAILSSLALILMPTSSELWMAAGLLWILDTAANISTEPFRAFVGDLLRPEQRDQGFAMQSLMIGLGAVTASAFPWILTHFFGISTPDLGKYSIPSTVKLSFDVGAVVLLTTVLWTIFTTDEYPPTHSTVYSGEPQNQILTEKKQVQASPLKGNHQKKYLNLPFPPFRKPIQNQKSKIKNQILRGVEEIYTAFIKMPETMKQLAWVQGFTWMGMYCIFLYFPPAVAYHIFQAGDQHSAVYTEGIEWAGLCMAAYNAVCFIFSLILPQLAQATSRQFTHSFCLVCGAVALLSLFTIKNQYILLLPMIGIGIAWSSILAMPYAMLIECIPAQKTGIYLGIFNFFIVLPQITVSLGMGWVMNHLLTNNRLIAVIIGGFFWLIAAMLTYRVEPSEQQILEQQTPSSSS